MEKFTDGDWRVENAWCGYEILSHDGNDANLVCGVDGDISNEDDEFNAHLIAAAPDMYRMLKMLEGFESSNGKAAWAHEITELLAKARGE